MEPELRDSGLWLIGLGFHANLGPRGIFFGEVTMGVCKQEFETRWLLSDNFLVTVTAAKPSVPGYCEVPLHSLIFLPFPVTGLNWFPFLEAE